MAWLQNVLKNMNNRPEHCTTLLSWKGNMTSSPFLQYSQINPLARHSYIQSKNKAKTSQKRTNKSVILSAYRVNVEDINRV